MRFPEDTLGRIDGEGVVVVEVWGACIEFCFNLYKSHKPAEQCPYHWCSWWLTKREKYLISSFHSNCLVMQHHWLLHHLEEHPSNNPWVQNEIFSIRRLVVHTNIKKFTSKLESKRLHKTFERQSYLLVHLMKWRVWQALYKQDNCKTLNPNHPGVTKQELTSSSFDIWERRNFFLYFMTLHVVQDHGFHRVLYC